MPLLIFKNGTGNKGYENNCFVATILLKYSTISVVQLKSIIGSVDRKFGPELLSILGWHMGNTNPAIGQKAIVFFCYVAFFTTSLQERKKADYLPQKFPIIDNQALVDWKG